MLKPNIQNILQFCRRYSFENPALKCGVFIRFKVCLQLLQVDAGMTGVSGVKSRKLYQVMDTLTVTNHGDIEFVVVANDKWLSSLTQKQRDAIAEASKVAEKAVRDDMANIEAGAYKEAKANGMNIVNLSSSEVSALKKASERILKIYES